MLDRVVCPAGEALAAREVVERPCVLRMSFDQLASPIGSLGVFAGLVEVVERQPKLAALGFVRLPRSSAKRDERRSRLPRERRPLDLGASEDECACGCVDTFAVELERRAPCKSCACDSSCSLMSRSPAC
jgi:hypothetical protein